METRLRDALPRVRPRGLRLAPHRTAPRQVTRAGQEVVECFLAFETATGSAEGVARLLPDAGGPGGLRAWILLTALQDLLGHPDRAGRQHTSEKDYSRDFGGPNWADKRAAARAYADHDPAVIVVGCGQAGLGIAARLGALGIDTLVVDREERVGDNWRRRYHSLTLHNEVHVNHLPYMPFPPTWPVFIPKDMLAAWFEAYVEALELNVWTGTGLEAGGWDEAAQCWQVTLRRADGGTRVMRPRHLVFATGVSGIPIMPEAAGARGFPRHGDALRRLYQRHGLEGEAGHRARYRQQRP
ncbi:hypothetical protein [Dankookia sp. P2]|uniref:hypothetical protein n=1 Tax=Dankookia sp. P2 TaxID=3423955 RepID=UPI003D67E355